MYPNCSSAFTPFLVHALHPYRHSSSDSTSTHLAFDKHQAILVITKHTSGWWDGELADGKRGWFPGHYVELAKTDEHEGGERGRDGESMEGRAEVCWLMIPCEVMLFRVLTIYLHHVSIGCSAEDREWDGTV